MSEATAPRVDGTAGDDILIGIDGLKNVLYGGYGNDLLIGGSLNDTLVGEAGHDTLSGGLGSDAMWGGGGNDSLFGDSGADLLVGDGGNDVLDGGAGADVMRGGIGNDTYAVDDAGDTVTELASQGTDTVRASISYTLGSHVERLSLTGSAHINATGNTGANLITGNSGNNIIDGGAGADTMQGGAGNDTYYADSASDRVVEHAGEGYDILVTRYSTVLSAHVEQLVLVGTGNITATGNDLDNIIIGSNGKNAFKGMGGNDTIDGAAGNDTIFGGEGADDLIGGDGIDMLNGGAANDSVSGGLGADSIFGGGGNDMIFGEDGNDKICGDGGNDTLLGGAGDDWLMGGQNNGKGLKGADTFVWSRADVVAADGRQAGFDRILDFSSLDSLDFTELFSNTHPLDLEPVIRVTDTKTGTVIAANLGDGHFYDVVLLSGVHGVALDDLIAHHQIVV